MTCVSAGARSVTTSSGSAWALERGGEEPPRRGNVATSGDVHVDDLATLVHGPVHVPPDAGHLDIGLVDEPAAANAVPGRAGRVNHKRREVLHPPIQRDVIYFYPAFRRGALRGRGTTSRTAGTSAPPARSPLAGTGSQRTPTCPAGPDGRIDDGSSKHPRRSRPTQQSRPAIAAARAGARAS